MNDFLTSADPAVSDILKELQDCLTNSSGLTDQQEADWRTRMCLWSGQSDDGRKWKDRLGVDPMPWNGASDQRVRAVDEVINEQVALMLEAFSRSMVQVTSSRGDSMGASQLVNHILTWLFKVHLRSDLERELELYANYRQQYGMAVMGVWWEQRRQLENEEIDLEKTYADAQEDPEKLTSLALLVEKLQDPLAEEEMLAFIRGYSESISKKQARVILNELRETGRSLVPRETMLSSLPCWEALRPFVDVFFPVATKSMQAARWIAKIEWVTATELADRATTDDYDEEFIDAALKTKGKDWEGNILQTATDWTRARRGSTSPFLEDVEDLIQIFHVYRRGTDTDTGVPAIYCTVISPHVPKLAAKHELLPYKHGRFPFVAGVREYVGRSMSESRSVPELGKSLQDSIKAQSDARTDYTSIATIPPVIVPPNRGKTRLEFGPGVQHTERRSGELRWMAPPPGNLGASVEVERSSQERLDRYFGRNTQTVNPVLSQLLQTRLVNKFLSEVQEMATQTVQLAQQYLPETTVERITGGQRVPFSVSRDEIQGQFDIRIAFDVANLDRELLKQKLEFLQGVMGMDQTGQVDRAGAVNWAMGSFDPLLAQQLVGDPQAVAANETEDEQKNFALITSGVEPPMRESGQNYQLRLQTLLGIVQQNPEAAQSLEVRADRKALFENRVKHLQFMIQQQTNANTGRTGAEPLMEPTA
jgi:hypothetical protein